MVPAQLLPHVVEDAADEPRDLHLADADGLADLRLAPVLEEPQVEDPLVPLVQGAHDGRQRHPCVARGERVLAVVVGQQVAQGAGAVLADGLVQRARGEAAPRAIRLVVLLGGDAHRLDDLVLGRLAAELLTQVLEGAAQPALELLEASRRPHHPAVVAEVAGQLAAHRRHGEGEQVVAALGLEAGDRHDQADVGHLDEVVVGEPAAPVAPGDRLGDAAVDQHELAAQVLAGVVVLGSAEPVQQRLGARGTLRAGEAGGVSRRHGSVPRTRCGPAVCSAVRPSHNPSTIARNLTHKGETAPRSRGVRRAPGLVRVIPGTVGGGRWDL